MINYILCDDNDKHNIFMRKRIEKILEKNKLEGTISLCSNKPNEVILYSKKNVNKNNVYILDIDFKLEFNGVELARIIRQNEKNAYIIFVSAYQEYSIQCFKIKTFDFLVKPIQFKDLEECIISLNKDFDHEGLITSATISIKSGSHIHIINIEDIIYFEKYGQLLIVHTLKGIIRCYETLERMQDKLYEYDFFRCHKSYLINKKFIENVCLNENIVEMKLGDKCLISRKYKKDLKDYVASFL